MGREVQKEKQFLQLTSIKTGQPREERDLHITFSKSLNIQSNTFGPDLWSKLTKLKILRLKPTCRGKRREHCKRKRAEVSMGRGVQN